MTLDIVSQDPLVEQEVGLALQHSLLRHLGHTRVGDVVPALGQVAALHSSVRGLLGGLGPVSAGLHLGLDLVEELGDVARLADGRGEEGGGVSVSVGGPHPDEGCVVSALQPARVLHTPVQRVEHLGLAQGDAGHGEGGGRAVGGQVQHKGEAHVLVDLLAAGERLLEPLEVEGEDGGRAEHQELLAGGRVHLHLLLVLGRVLRSVPDPGGLHPGAGVTGPLVGTRQQLGLNKKIITG